MYNFLFGNIDTLTTKKIEEIGKMIEKYNLSIVELFRVNKVYSLYEIHTLTMYLQKICKKYVKIFTYNIPIKGYN